MTSLIDVAPTVLEAAPAQTHRRQWREASPIEGVRMLCLQQREG
jgi:hypothetical protein